MADIEINFGVAKLARVQTAFGKYLNTEGPATAAQIADHFKDEIRRITRNIERRDAEAAIQVPDL